MVADESPEAEPGTALLQERVGANVRAHRESQGLTQEQLAYRAGLATRHLQKIEAGKVNLTLRTIDRLCTALAVDAPNLFKRAEGSQ
jgi:transcriptional regulator with XRE-family HTH domain